MAGLKKKVLTVCNGGNSRSTMLAEVLKGTFGCDAIAIGTYWAEEPTMEMLCEWADLIALVEPFDAILPEPDLTKWKQSPVWWAKYAFKRVVAKVGPDAWGHEKWQEKKIVCIAAAKELLGGVNL